ncbi:ATP-binding cassette domain-containing protein [Shewanella litorisediminis]|uniref:ATP-binding cassette domain-containing protein n=1 Tax=Shewanella litorisediminis TaxID=1173586 RepID=A0ABX7G7M7_9GAMM|nr:ATP-binding cassette domain-containing protein [Shewanella litorisediminis]MCL2920139.1 ATP-binding cassette domain-containing protein [Shewanella litorisediminis]QRH03253.1 ATP-binding cassette domain-containing protein [Shewanella litorisediminis]
MLVIDRLSLDYGGREVIKDLSVVLHSGQKVAILGASGAGKSTLLAHIHRQLKDTAALCAQSQGLVENLSLYHNIYMGALGRHHGLYNLANLLWPFKAPLAEVNALCRTLELEMSPSTLVSRLSGGQRQRVAIGRALYQHQPIFLGDEPVSALDPAMADRIIRHITASHATVVMVLHNRHQALTHFDRILGLKKGQLVLDADASALTLADLDAFYGDVEKDDVVKC